MYFYVLVMYSNCLFGGCCCKSRCKILYTMSFITATQRAERKQRTLQGFLPFLLMKFYGKVIGISLFNDMLTCTCVYTTFLLTNKYLYYSMRLSLTFLLLLFAIIMSFSFEANNNIVTVLIFLTTFSALVFSDDCLSVLRPLCKYCMRLHNDLYFKNNTHIIELNY